TKRAGGGRADDALQRQTDPCAAGFLISLIECCALRTRLGGALPCCGLSFARDRAVGLGRSVWRRDACGASACAELPPRIHNRIGADRQGGVSTLRKSLDPSSRRNCA